MKIPDIKKFLVLGFVALGPLGNLLTPHFFPKAFRSYYFLLPTFPLFFWQFKGKQLKVLIFFIPFLLYCSVSALYVELFGQPSEPFPLFRFFLLLFNFCFIIGASFTLTTLKETGLLINLYLKSFFISLGIGTIFYIGFYLNYISLPLIERFSVLTQFGYGHLRFSPGSYPNEYGTLTSFVLSILTLHIIRPCKELNLTKKQTLFFFILTFAAMLLTTTRSAYLGYLFCFFYIAWKTKRFFQTLRWLSLAFLALLFLFRCFGINLLEILYAGFNFVSFQDGSAGERLSHWSSALEDFQLGIFFGNGFASITNLHNVYLQLLFELGLLGIAILFGTFLLWIFNYPLRISNKIDDSNYFFFNSLRMMGLIQVLWFAISNHNLNHHLTWFILFLFIKGFKENVFKVEQKI